MLIDDDIISDDKLNLNSYHLSIFIDELMQLIKYSSLVSYWDYKYYFLCKSSSYFQK